MGFILDFLLEGSYLSDSYGSTVSGSGL